MVHTLKSVLLFDYDSLYRSLNDRAPGAGDWLGARAGTWLDAIEAGEVVHTTDVDRRARRLIQTKRCYANPKLLGKNRGWLAAAGVEIVDCAPVGGLDRSAADVNLVLDAVDAAEADPDEIIILSAEIDLTPVLYRLRALNQRVIVYATDAIAASYRTLADGVVDESRLIEVLSQPSGALSAADSIPRPPRITAPPIRASERRSGQRPSRSLTVTGKPIDREALATLVRRIHQVTNVPLFSPRAFSDLFRLIVQEVAENGYKFQATVENVTSAMNRLGRSVTKRQVGFVVKGMALRGHVFTPADPPEQLAGVFYEQVLYLVEGTDLQLSEEEKGLVSAWIGGVQRPAVTHAPAPRPAGAPQRRPAPEPAEARPAAPRPAPESPRAEAPSRSATPRPAARDDLRRPSASEAPHRRFRPVFDDEPAVAPGHAAQSSPPRRAPQQASATPPSRPAIADTRREEELENSILSAIADAVDVLAEDRPNQRPRSAPPPRRAAAPEAPVVRGVRPPPLDRSKEDDAQTDEIGDEIQRILASYSANR